MTPTVRRRHAAVVPLSADDASLDRIVAIEAATFDRPWTRDAFRAELARPDRRYVIAVGDDEVVGRDDEVMGDGEVVGYGGVALQAGDAHVMTLAVAAEARRQGHGERLVRGLVDAAVSAGADGVTLEVRATNVAAQRLYRRVGFTAAGVRPGYYPDGEDAVIMWWRPGGSAPDAPAPASTPAAAAGG